MKLRASSLVRALKNRLLDEARQAMTEYISITTIMLFGTLAAGAAWPFSRLVFQALQAYINFYYFALNVAVG